jgi:hypothetical protein
MRILHTTQTVLILSALLAACSSTQQTTTTTTQPVDVPMATARFIHAIPDAPSADITIGDTSLGTDIGYQQWGDYIEFEAGEQDITMRRGETVVYADSYDFAPDGEYLIIAYGMLNPIGGELGSAFLIAPEEDVDDTEDESWIRVANAASDGDALGFVTTTGGGWRLLFPNQGIGTLSEYKRAPLYENTFDIIPARDTSLPAVHSFEDHLPVGLLYTIVISGRNSNGTIEAFTVTDSPSRI